MTLIHCRTCCCFCALPVPLTASTHPGIKAAARLDALRRNASGDTSTVHAASSSELGGTWLQPTTMLSDSRACSLQPDDLVGLR